MCVWGGGGGDRSRGECGRDCCKWWRHIFHCYGPLSIAHCSHLLQRVWTAISCVYSGGQGCVCVCGRGGGGSEKKGWFYCEKKGWFYCVKLLPSLTPLTPWDTRLRGWKVARLFGVGLSGPAATLCLPRVHWGSRDPHSQKSSSRQNNLQQWQLLRAWKLKRRELRSYH